MQDSSRFFKEAPPGSFLAEAPALMSWLLDLLVNLEGREVVTSISLVG